MSRTLLLAAIVLQFARAQDAPPAAPPAANHVLRLDGDGDFVELPADSFDDLEDVTVEAWVKWESFQSMSRVFDFVLKGRTLVLYNRGTIPLLWAQQNAAGIRHHLEVQDFLRAGNWVHLALVAEGESMKLYANGVLQANQVVSVPDTFRASEFSRLNLLGRSNGRVVYPGNQDFHGEIDDVRVWRGARTAEQIRGNLFTELTGDEEGLVSLWKFEEAKDGIVADSGPGGHHGKLNGDAGVVAEDRPDAVEPAAVTGWLAESPGQRGGVAPGLVDFGLRPVLGFSEGESFMDLPAGILDGLEELTFEAWVFWDQLTPNRKLVSFGNPGGLHRLTVRT